VRLRFVCLACCLATRIFAAGLPEEGVSHDLARDRAHLISNVRYRLNVQLAKGAATMPGHAVIQFDLSGATPLVLDFRDGEARNMVVNGSPQPFGRRNGHLTIPGGHFHAGANQIELDFESGIAVANRAITRFVDNQDGAEYLYTLFVPMDADQAFPCFDQPDLKARFRLNVTAPGDWTVVSNTGAEAISAAGAINIIHFAETRPISTYLFAFAAGPFETLEGAGTAVPLRLFVRRSMIARAKEEWPRVSETVRQGMTLLSDYFVQPFPFPKYDEVLIPGFPYGGMEHAGATFLNEDTVLFRSVPTVNDYNRRAITVLHELAHQWFGDLVTMRWFDDLWLKEGFAQFMAYHTQAEMEPPDGVWKRFYESIKPAAYQIDGTHGTTPIYQQIANLKDAKSAYGAIVYEKAPSLLRLLNFNIGEEHFRDGIRIFLREHAYSNATWSDLIGAFSRASSSNLTPWADAWVQQRGMPAIEVNWACSGGRISSFRINQRDTLAEKHVWPVRTGIFLAHHDGAPVRLMASLNTASAPVAEAIGKDCPDYVFANDADNAYGRFLLDRVSQTAVVQQLGSIADPFLRALLWGALWDDMRELRLSPVAFANLALTLLPGERDAESAASILGRLRVTYTDYLNDRERDEIAPKIENLFIEQLTGAPTADLRITYFRGFVAIAKTSHAREALNSLFAGHTSIPDVPLKQRDRWNIIAALMALGDPSGPELLAAESKRDTSEDGRKYSFVSAAGVGTAENKKKFFTDFVSNSAIAEDWVTASLGQFNRWDQTSLTLPFLKPALEALPQMKRERKIFFVLNWLDYFVDNQNSATALKVVDDFLAANTADPDLKLKILEVRDELARTVRIRAGSR
jgi:aminopeptidase N